MRRSKIRKRKLYVGLTILLVTWMAAHYCLIALQLLPANAISILNPQPVQSYVQPFFDQNWHLFAPSPPLSNDRYLIQLCVQSRTEKQPRLSEWLDVSSPLLNATWYNPLSPAVTRFRTIEGVSAEFSNLVTRKAAMPGYVLSTYDLYVTDTLNQLLVSLSRELYDPSQFRLLAVRERIVIEEIPPFSELENRRYMTRELKSMTFDWFQPETTEEN